MCALLLVVGFSDLKGKDVELNESAPETDASGGESPSSEALSSSAGTHQDGKRVKSVKKARPMKMSS